MATDYVVALFALVALALLFGLLELTHHRVHVASCKSFLQPVQQEFVSKIIFGCFPRPPNVTDLPSARMTCCASRHIAHYSIVFAQMFVLAVVGFSKCKSLYLNVTGDKYNNLIHIRWQRNVSYIRRNIWKYFASYRSDIPATSVIYFSLRGCQIIFIINRIHDVHIFIFHTSRLHCLILVEKLEG